MREWNLKSGDPQTLIIAADSRFSKTDYCNDQIWELASGGGEPPALAVQTTFGLRARGLRIFPRFTEGDLTRSDPAEFSGPVTIRQIYPNLLEATFSPLTGIDVRAKYWVPCSQAIAGRLVIENHSEITRQMALELVSLLSPGGEGSRMVVLEKDSICFLGGRTSRLYPVLMMSGICSASTGPYPALSIQLQLPPGASYVLDWSEAALDSQEDSYRLAQETLKRNWEAELARIEMMNSGLIEIHTGDPEWDTAFWLAQKTALSLVMSPTAKLPDASFVLSRQPDLGFSLRGDGQDYTQLWEGQSPLDTYMLLGLLLPSATETAKGLLQNFLSTALPTGFIDFRPGLGGQRSQVMAMPILASIAWRIYTSSGDLGFLKEVFPALLAFYNAWFTPEHDRDQDGIPELSHPMQTGVDDHPLFAYWQPTSLGIDVSTTESPALCSFLYSEGSRLVEIANRLHIKEGIPAVKKHMSVLKKAVEQSWDEGEAIYRYQDRDSHAYAEHEVLDERMGPGEILVERSFEQPVRLLVRIHASDESSRRPQLFVHGFTSTGQHLVEHITPDRFHWYLGTGTATGERIYTEIERVEIQGVVAGDQISVQTAGYQCQDITQLLPLWAGIPKKKTAQRMVEKTILTEEDFWKPAGLPICARLPQGFSDDICDRVSIVWNTLIGEGLLAYGFRAEAARLVQQLMVPVIQSLKTKHAFYRYYQASNGVGRGERDALEGLAPLALFLETLGVRLVSSKKVYLQGRNPFPWPVTVKYRGLRILRQMDRTTVIFPGGQTTDITTTASIHVSME